jgi:transcriptional regulator with XRE-family HTH domain
MSLYRLREARNLTQVNLAKILEVNQGAVSRLEKRTDVYVSTLRSYIEAMGGQLQIRAVFPDAVVEIDQFAHLPALDPSLDPSIEPEPEAEQRPIETTQSAHV